MSRSSSRSVRRDVDGKSNNERGSVLVELAIIIPVLVSLVLGMLELGMAWRDKATVTQASRQGARTAAHLGDEYWADREAIVSLHSVFDGAQPDNIEFVIIYDASAADGSLPATCVPTPAGPHVGCNFYTAAMIAQVNDASLWNAADGCPDPTRYDAGWCPTSRSDDLVNPDHVGVMVRLNRQWITGVLPGDGTTITERTVMRLEPERS